MTNPTLAEILKADFPGLRFPKSMYAQAGKVLKRDGAEATVSFLHGKGTAEPGTFSPPAKTLIVAQSRPFSEWPISKASGAIQEHFFKLTLEEFEASDPGLNKESYQKWRDATGVDTHGYFSVQGLGKIFGSARETYLGTIKKVENRNRKAAQKLERINASRAADGLPLKVLELETAFKETGHLLHPPGINPTLYCYQQTSPRPCKNTEGYGLIPPEYVGYTQDPDAIIPMSPSRLAIPKGQPGHVPGAHRVGLSAKPNRRRRAWYSNTNTKPKPNRTATFDPAKIAAAKAQDALLVSVHIEDDWLLLDARGLLRNARYRGLVPKEGISLKGLLALFTGDPVIDPQRGQVTFLYKATDIGIFGRKPIKNTSSPELLQKLTRDGQRVALVSIDLGQTHPMAIKVSKVSSVDGCLKADHVSRMFLPDHLLAEIRSYRAQVDHLRDTIRQQALQSLTAEQQAEIQAVASDGWVAAQGRMCAHLGIRPEDVPWTKMTGGTTFLAEAALARGASRDLVFFTPAPKKPKKGRDGKIIVPKSPPKPREPVIRRDQGFSKVEGIRLKVSEDTRTALNEAIWKLQNESLEYRKLSQRKLEFARRCVNYVISEARKLTQCETIVINVEDLNVSFFHGSGKRLPGWAEFFVYKKENRWLIQVLHKALTELAPHRGMYVIESFPQRTSITCPPCGHCDAGNRNGVVFCCLKCGVRLHADLEVAVDNLEAVAISGVPMPKPPREKAPGKKKAGPARSQKSAKNKPSLEDPACTVPQMVFDNSTAREAQLNYP